MRFIKFLIPLLFAASAFGQCGANGRLILNPLTGLFDCTGNGVGGSGFTPTAQAVTSGVTTSVTIALNGTLSDVSQALPSCAITSGRTGTAQYTGWSLNSGLTQMTIDFSGTTTANFTGSCTAVISNVGPIGATGATGAGCGTLVGVINGTCGATTFAASPSFTGTVTIGNTLSLSGSGASTINTGGSLGTSGTGAFLGQKPAYLLATFSSGAATTTGGGLWLAPSNDAKNFSISNQIYPPGCPCGLRDPSIIYYGGYFYAAYTNVASSGLATSTFTIVKSLDLKNWTAVATPSPNGSATRVWSPEFYLNSDGTLYIFTAVSTTDETAFSIYRQAATASDLTTWSAGTSVYSSNNPIDPAIFVSAGTYYLFFKNNTANFIGYATASSITGAWTTGVSGAADTLSLGTAEGPYLMQYDSSTVYMLLDKYTTTGLSWSTTTSFPTGWSAPAAIGTAFTSTSILHHGGLIKTLDLEAADVINRQWFSSTPVLNFTTLKVNSTATLLADESASFGKGSGGTAAYLRLDTGAAQYSGARVYLNNVEKMEWGVDSSSNSYLYAISNNYLYFGTNSAERMRISAAGGVSIGNTTDPGATNLSVAGSTSSATYVTATNCSSSASPAVCSAAAAGSVAVPTGTNPTLVVNTTVVTANSQIMVVVDESLGTKLSVTCNTTLSTLPNPVVTARTAGTSFTITIGAIVATNPACVSYQIIN